MLLESLLCPSLSTIVSSSPQLSEVKNEKAALIKESVNQPAWQMYFQL